MTTLQSELQLREHKIDKQGHQLVIALSARWCDFPQRFDRIAENGFALEYTPNPEALELLPLHVDPYLRMGVPMRYHGFFPGYEIGYPNKEMADRAMRIHQSSLEAIAGRGQPVITFHIGLDWNDDLNPDRVIENLSRLSEQARALGITICIENLRRGPASHPENIAQWAKLSGARITLDIGHATCCRRAKEGELTLTHFIDMFQDHLHEVHMYEQESDRHYPPENMDILGPAVDRLLNTGCNWWTIELTDCVEALATRDLLLNHLQQ